MGHILANTWKFDQISPMVMLYFSILTVPKSYPERQSFRLEPSKCHNFALLTFPAFRSGEQTQRHEARFGCTVSYKSLYFVHLSLELVVLFTEVQKGLISYSFLQLFRDFGYWPLN